jgi:hypothetical protein
MAGMHIHSSKHSFSIQFYSQLASKLPNRKSLISARCDQKGTILLIIDAETGSDIAVAGAPEN